MRFSIQLLLAVAIVFFQHTSPVFCQPVVDQNIQTDTIAVDSLYKNAFTVDSLSAGQDSLPLLADSVITKSIPISNDTIDAEVTYTAEDSIIYNLEEKKVHLYGKATASYKAIKLESDYIVYDWANSTLSAEMNKDSLGNIVGYAKFTEGASNYEAKKLSYNFKTTKGKIYTVWTQEGEGYVQSEAVKKNQYNEWYGYRGKYTTCNLEHPHFYFRAKKMKVVPDKVMVSGPANLVIEDVPLPLYLPFAIFPIKKGQRSGVLLPEYGEEQQRGFFLRNGGYYFGISDYFDLALRADIYTKGSWALRVGSNYTKRYKFSGNINAMYGRNRINEPESPDFYKTSDFLVNWSHTQRSKEALNSRFTANVNFGSSSNNRNFPDNRDRVLTNSLASKVSYSKSWAGTPLSFSVNLSHDQNLNTGVITLQLPIISFGVSRITPFQSKKPSVKPKWYESIGFSYSLDARNSIVGTDSTFLRKETFKDARYGIRHQLPISSSFKLFKYFTLTPSINYTERWYFKTVEKRWVQNYLVPGTDDSLINTVLIDTIDGFKAARDFNFRAGLTTKLYGQLNFKGKLKAIRHVLTPTLSFGYTPDFSTSFWGYYKQVQRDTTGKTELYSVFNVGNNEFGVPPAGTSGVIGLSLANVLEMKVFSKKDTVKNEKKIKLLEGLNIGASYNLAADSLNLSTIGISGRSTLLPGKLDFNFNFVLDPYIMDTFGRRLNTFVWERDRRLTKLTRANFTTRLTFQSKKGEKVEDIPVQPDSFSTQEELDFIYDNRDLYYNFNIPWSFDLTYNVGLERGRDDRYQKLGVGRNSVEFRMDANITPKWKIELVTGYDFKLKDVVYTELNVIRDLHCWDLKFNWVPYPLNQQRYSMQLNVKARILQDMKLTRKKDRLDSVF